MIRTVWFYVVLVVTSVIHAGGVLVAALVGVKRRPGGVYGWGATDWARDIIAAAGTPGGLGGRGGSPPHPPVVDPSERSSLFGVWPGGAGRPGSVRFGP